MVVKIKYVGHITHLNTYGVFISYCDANGNMKAQYYKVYECPIPNHDFEGKNGKYQF